MKKSVSLRIAALVLTLGMLLSLLSLTALAAGDSSSAEDEESRLAKITELLEASTYENYKALYKNAKPGTAEIVIPGVDYDAEKTNAAVEVKDCAEYQNQSKNVPSSIVLDVPDGQCLYTPNEGAVCWNFEMPESGIYNIEMVYYPINGNATTSERCLRIDGKYPFKEARSFKLRGLWQDEFFGDERENAFEKDISGNEIRPVKSEKPSWLSSYILDATGYESFAYDFYIEEGSHVLSLEGIKEQIAIQEIRIVYAGSAISYEEYKEENSSASRASESSVIKIQAETPLYTSDSTTSATYDKSSAITEPQSADSILYNTFGASNWSSVGQSVSYDLTVEESGMYSIALRFRQDTSEGMFSSRKLLIDGQVPFIEAESLRFAYSSDWQSAALGNAATGETYEFYLEKGEHVITFEAVLGDMSSVLARTEGILNNVNSIYRSILMYTGSTPDEYRDYNFNRYIPEVIDNMGVQAQSLYEISEYLETVVGTKGETSVTIDKIAYLLQQMHDDEDNIAINFSTLKTYIGNLGSWILGAKSQPLEVDFIQVQSVDSDLPDDSANFFEAFWHEFKSFIASFYTDYTSMGVTESTGGNTEIEVWMYSGRDQMQILRNMINDDFSVNSGIKVNLKLVTAAMLMPATLSGAGPDVSMANAASNTINYAIRSAVQPIMEDWSEYDEVCARFNSASLDALRLYNMDYGETLLYGLPEAQTFLMMFYRSDILAELGVEIPETWNDLYDIIPALQASHLTVGLPVYSSSTTGAGTTAATAFLTGVYYTMIVQKGEGIYRDAVDGDDATYGMSVNFDSNVGLDCFKELVEYFSMYQLDVSYDFANRFRTGEMPIALADYTAYNQLTIFAPEISGLWEMVHVPGTLMEDGSINYDTVSSVSSVMMMANDDRTEEETEASWEFMKWWTSTEAQSRYSTNMVSLLGASGQQSTANIKALDKLPWPSNVLSELKDQFGNIASVPEMPGGYIIPRNIEFAFLDAYNNSASPVDALLEYVGTINSELSRKRTEFDLPTLENYKEYLENK